MEIWQSIQAHLTIISLRNQFNREIFSNLEDPVLMRVRVRLGERLKGSSEIEGSGNAKWKQSNQVYSADSFLVDKEMDDGKVNFVVNFEYMWTDLFSLLTISAVGEWVFDKNLALALSLSLPHTPAAGIN